LGGVTGVLGAVAGAHGLAGAAGARDEALVAQAARVAGLRDAGAAVGLGAGVRIAWGVIAAADDDTGSAMERGHEDEDEREGAVHGYREGREADGVSSP